MHLIPKCIHSQISYTVLSNSNFDVCFVNEYLIYNIETIEVVREKQLK